MAPRSGCRTRCKPTPHGSSWPKVYFLHHSLLGLLCVTPMNCFLLPPCLHLVPQRADRLCRACPQNLPLPQVALQLRMVLPGSETAAAGGSKPPGQQAWEARQDAVIQRGSNGNGAARRPSTSGNGSGPPSPAQVGWACVSWRPLTHAIDSQKRGGCGMRD